MLRFAFDNCYVLVVGGLIGCGLLFGLLALVRFYLLVWFVCVWQLWFWVWFAVFCLLLVDYMLIVLLFVLNFVLVLVGCLDSLFPVFRRGCYMIQWLGFDVLRLVVYLPNLIACLGLVCSLCFLGVCLILLIWWFWCQIFISLL